MQTEYFTTSLEHILAELKRIDLLIQLHLMQTRQLHQYGDGFEGHDIQGQTVDELRTALDHMAGEIWLRKAESERQNIRLRLDELSVLFGLDPLELDIFLICLAPDLDLLNEKIYAYLQDDVTKTQPSVRLVSNLLYPLLSAELNARKLFEVESSLCKNFLLHVLDDPFHQQPLSPRKCLKVDERIVNHLLDLEIIDTNLQPHVRRATNHHGLEDISLPVDLKHRLALMAQEREDCRQKTIIHFKGPHGIGKKSTAEALCNDLNLGLLIIDLQSMLNDDRLGFEKALRLVLREAILQQAALYWQGFDLLLSEDKRDYLYTLLLELGTHRGLSFLSGEKTLEPLNAFSNRAFTRISFPGRDRTKRVDLWSEFSDGGSHQIPNPELSEIAYAPRFIGDQIRNTGDAATPL